MDVPIPVPPLKAPVASERPSVRNATSGLAISWRWLGLGAAAIIVALVLLEAVRPASETVRYTTALASRGNLVRTISATGTVNPELTIIVGSYVSGVIQSLSCDYNTKVTAGQICAKIDPRPYQTAVDQAKANLAVSRAQLEKDKANLAYTKVNSERLSWLEQHDAAARDAADLSRSNYNQAQAQVGLDAATIEQRQAELEAAEINLGYTNITSPVEGTVVSRNVTQGQTVAASFQTPTLFLIATDLTKMEVDTNVSESDIGGIKEDDKASFTVDTFPRRVFEGRVTQVRQSPQTVQNVVTFDAVIGIGNADGALKPGMTASTRIVTDERTDVLRVPNQALRYSPAGAGIGEAGARVWALREGKPVRVAVTLGVDDENFTEIAAGDLKPGDRVIVGEERAQAPSVWQRFGF
jgi:HlyD family secretion protein